MPSKTVEIDTGSAVLVPVVARLEQLHEAPGADELAITTITHDHVDRVSSYQLLAKAWLG